MTTRDRSSISTSVVTDKKFAKKEVKQSKTSEPKVQTKCLGHRCSTVRIGVWTLAIILMIVVIACVLIAVKSVRGTSGLCATPSLSHPDSERSVTI